MWGRRLHCCLFKQGWIFKAGPEEMSAFAAGELDLGYVGQAPATAAYLNRVADIKFISQSNLEGTSIVVRTDSKIESVSDLTGRTIAIPGHATMQDFLLRKALMKYGLSFNDIRDYSFKTAGDDPGVKTEKHRRLLLPGSRIPHRLRRTGPVEH